MRSVEFSGESVVRVGDVPFIYGFPLPPAPSPGTLRILKSRALIERLVHLTEVLVPSSIVELGIHRGGSTAFLASRCDPDKLVAVDLVPDRVPELDDFLDQHDLRDNVTALYGVDQADKRALRKIVDAEFAGQPLDLVFDDASHLYGPTRSSFEALFPYLRPGGCYVIEDWGSEHTKAAMLLRAVVGRVPRWQSVVERLAVETATFDEALADRLRSNPTQNTIAEASRQRAHREGKVPLSRLGLELVQAAACMRAATESANVIRRVNFSQPWIEIERGEAQIDPTQPWLSDASMDLFGSLLPIDPATHPNT